MTDGPSQRVASCRSESHPNGSAWWVGALACGCGFRVPRRAVRGVKDRPAPVRKRCGCSRSVEIARLERRAA